MDLLTVLDHMFIHFQSLLSIFPLSADLISLEMKNKVEDDRRRCVVKPSDNSHHTHFAVAFFSLSDY